MLIAGHIHAALAADHEPCLHGGPDQPACLPLGIEDIRIGGDSVPVTSRDVSATPFHAHVGLVRADQTPTRQILVVPPISGHFPVLLRDLLIGLLPDFKLHVIDWVNPRHIARRHGPFSYEDNIAVVAGAARALGRDAGILALCQAGPPALAATAVLAAEGEAPAALALLGAPIDPIASPTSVSRRLRATPLSWLRAFALSEVPYGYAGHGRAVYPAGSQLMALNNYRMRCMGRDCDIARKMRHDDGLDPEDYPFSEMYSAIMDIDGRHFIENIDRVFQKAALRNGTMEFMEETVRCDAVARTALMTVEGMADEIAAPGQTAAAHGFCPRVPDDRRVRASIPGAGHFDLFHGSIWRETVLPQVRDFLLRHTG